MLRKSGYLFLSLVTVGLFYMVGCNQQSPSPEPATPQAASPATPAPSANEEHGHQAGAHGGTIVSIGLDSYHAEAVFEKGGLLRIYTLGKDESRVIDVDEQTLTAYAKAEGDDRASSMSLKPEPQPGDAAGKTSQFVGQMPDELIDKPVQVTIPSITIAGERFRLAFTSVTESHADGMMPDKVANEEEKALYLTPGGKYTQEDIEANGNATVSQKFKSFKAAHDLHPKAGDKICPITLTKANPECSWIIGGKTYEFCCPPCVDEFVRMAKQEPEKIDEPGAYVKR